jgi:hypothetical protein
MSMSKDRVHFRLIDCTSTSDRSAQERACQEAFKLAPVYSRAAAQRGVEIICRPSQFARFIILRGVYGGQNLIKALNPRLVTPEPQPVDVSRNPA